MANKRVAMIKDGLVVGIAVWDGVQEWNPGPEFTLLELPGIDYVGPEFDYEMVNDEHIFTSPDGEVETVIPAEEIVIVQEGEVISETPVLDEA